MNDQPSKPAPPTAEGSSTGSIVSALIVGFVAWVPVLLLFSPPIGRADANILIFYGPLLVCFMPLAWRALMNDELERCLWLLAIAPVAGAINAFVCLLLTRTVSANEAVLALLATSLWAIPLVTLFRRRK